MIVLILAVLGLESSAAGAQERATSRGFKPETVFEVGEVDSINLFNGNLTLSLPIGQSYNSNGSLSYGFNLVYNSSVWDLRERPFEAPQFCEPRDRRCSEDPIWRRAIPNPLSNAGLGWMLTLGQLYPPHFEEDVNLPGGGDDPQLTVTVSGRGRVVSDPAGIDCGSDCSQRLTGFIALVAEPDPGWVFASWSGSCSGGNAAFTLEMTHDDRSCHATFTDDGDPPQTTHTLNISYVGWPGGWVEIQPGGHVCDATRCDDYDYDDGTEITLTAHEDGDLFFEGWLGADDCNNAGDRNPYSFALTERVDCAGSFAQTGPGPFTLGLGLTGEGLVRATSGLESVDCPPACDPSYPLDTLVQLEVFPNEGWSFSGWLESDPDCDDDSVTMNSHKTCAAKLKRDNIPEFDGLAEAGSEAGTVASNEASTETGSSAGELFHDEPIHDQEQWVYVSPDGARHALYDDLRAGEPDGSPATLYTSDNTFLRLRQDGQRKHFIDFPDGRVHTFEDFGGNDPGTADDDWRLTRIADPFGNHLRVSYSAPTERWMWTLSEYSATDSLVRQHKVHLDLYGLGYQVSSVELAAFGDTTAVYSFEYDVVGVDRDCRTNDPLLSPRVQLPLLGSVELPDGALYDFSGRYATECSGREDVPTGCIGETCEPPPPGSGRVDVGISGFQGGGEPKVGTIYSVSDLPGDNGGIDCRLQEEGGALVIVNPERCSDTFPQGASVALVAIPEGGADDVVWFETSDPACPNLLVGDGSTNFCHGHFRCIGPDCGGFPEPLSGSREEAVDESLAGSPAGPLTTPLPGFAAAHFASPPAPLAGCGDDFYRSELIPEPGDAHAVDRAPSGALESMRLPTRGQVEWQYGPYVLAGQSQPYMKGLLGVTERRHLDAGGALVGTWTYRSAVDRAPGPTGYDVLDPDTWPTETLTEVVYPTGDCSRHFFRAQGLEGNNDWDYGLPYTRACNAHGMKLSTQVFSSGTDGSCEGNPLRESFVDYEHDPEQPRPPLNSRVGDKAHKYDTNRRLTDTRTDYSSDGNRYTQTQRSDFDGFGHFGRTVDSGNLRAGDRRETVVDYDLAGTPAPGELWLLNMFSAQEVTENAISARTELGFNANTGFLLCQRTLAEGSTRSSRDVLVKFDRDSLGNRSRESWFGGDVPGGLATNGGTCSDNGGQSAYVIDHGYRWGALERSAFSGAGFADYEATLDQNTGLPSSTLDVSGRLATAFEYDSSGRLTRARPAEGACSTYTYSKASGSNTPAKVTVRERPNGCADIDLRYRELRFDGFGRLNEERRDLPGHPNRKRRHLYNARGWKTCSSEWGKSCGESWALGRTLTQFDLFARPTRVTAADGAVTDLEYSGLRRVDRTVTVTTDLGDVDATTEEHYDSFARLVEVKERSDEPNGNAKVSSTYSYDVAGRLASVSMGEQTRRFTYDQRGFLLTETHPETAAPIGYSLYDPRGNTGRREDNGVDLRFVYDSAARLVEVTTGDGRLLKEFAYGTSGRLNGRLQRATRHNRIILPSGYTYFSPEGATTTVRVRETYTWDGLGGRVSNRRTELLHPISYSFELGYTYDDLGNPSRIDYPECTHDDCVADLGGHELVIEPAYELGRLRAIPGWVDSVTYSNNGLWDSIALSNGVSERQTRLGSHNLRRPHRLYTQGATDDWDSGVFAYDGASNVTSIGTDAFRYDRVGRLQSAVVRGHSQAYDYDRYGNLTRVTTDGGVSDFAPESATNRIGTALATYDERGHVTWAGGRSYEYDELGDLVYGRSTGYEGDQAGDFTQVYTADGERIWSLDATGEEPLELFSLRGLDQQVLREFHRSDSQGWYRGREYIRGLGRLFASYRPKQAGIFDKNEKRWYHVDHLGTPRAITNSAAKTLERLDYFPFGEEIVEVGATPETGHRLKFTGHERDLQWDADATHDDLDYMHARYCHPVWGRFLAVDPARQSASPNQPQSWNRYSYTFNNPLLRVDRDGRIVETVWDLSNVAVGGASLLRNIATGNLTGAVIDAVGVAVDVTATAVPGVPGGAGHTIRAARLARNAAKGRAFENGVLKVFALSKNTKNRFLSSGKPPGFRIPDALSGKNSLVVEIKAVKKQGLTAQIRDFLAGAETQGQQLVLAVTKNTKLSKPLERLIEEGRLVVVRLDAR